MVYKEGVIKNLVEFIGKRLSLSLFITLRAERAEILAIINCCGIDYSGTYFSDFGPKSQKIDPQNTVFDESIAEINFAKYRLKANRKNTFHTFF